MRLPLFCLLLVVAGPAGAQETPADGAPPAPESPASAAPDTLQAAYEKEFAFLHAEQEALREQLEDLALRETTEVAEAEEGLADLEGRLKALQLRVQREEDALAALEREGYDAEEASEAVRTTLAQAATTLERPELEPAEDADLAARAEDLRAAYEGVASRIEDAGALRSSREAFFLRDGTRAEGTVIRAGGIAAWGVADQGAGALVPVGEGRLGLGPWEESAADARALAAGEAPATVGAYLMESTDGSFEASEEGGWSETLEQGGVIGVIILLLGAAALVMILIRSGLLAAIGLRSGARVDRVLELAGAGRLEEAREAAGAAGPVGRILDDLIRHAGRSRRVLEDLATEALLREQPLVQRFGTAITVIAAVAPLLGLLGTVSGMIATFDVITEFGTGNPKLLSGGIAEALVTTQLGLTVAIPTLLLGNLLNSQAARLLDRMETAALQMMNHLDDAGGDAGGEAVVLPRERVAHGG